MGSNSAHKFYITALIILLSALSASAYDMQRGMDNVAMSVYIDAQKHFEGGRYEKAKDTVEDFTRPTGYVHGLFLLLLGNIELKTGRSELAYGYYVKAADFYGDNTELYVQAASSAYAAGDTEAAQYCLQKASELGSEDSQVHRMTADIAAKNGNMAETASALERIKDKNDQDSKMLLYAYAKSGQIEKARHTLHHLTVHTQRKDWWKLYGMYILDSNPEEAAAAFRIYAKTAEVEPDELRMISKVLTQQKVYDEAFEILDRIEETSKNCYDISFQGRLALRLSRAEDSERLLLSALDKGCGKDAGQALAVLYYRTERYGKAAETFEKYSDKPEHIYMAALSHFKNGGYVEAERLLSSIDDKRIRKKAERLLKAIGEKDVK